MKIYYICDILLNEGAPAIHVLEISKSLSKNNEVNIFVPKIKRKTSIKNTSIINFLPYIDFNIIKSISYQFILFFSLLYKIIRNRPDIIYTRQSGFLIVPALLSKLLFVPYITEINGTIEEEMIADKDPKWMIKIATLIENFCYKNSTKIITTNEGLRDYLTKKYNLHPIKIEIVGIGVDTNRFLPKDKQVLKEKLNLSDNSYYIGYIGGIQHWQGVDYLIKSMKIITKKIPDCKLLIIGDGPEKQNLIKLNKKLRLEKNISFIDSVKNEFIRDYINAMDICICYLNKFKEGRYGPPAKVYEYLSCGKPVILSDIKGVSELFKDKVTLAKPENSKDLADKIIYLLKRPELRKRLSKGGRKFVLSEYSWKDIAKKIEKIILEAIKK